jgi:hypothetical protein
MAIDSTSTILKASDIANMRRVPMSFRQQQAFAREMEVEFPVEWEELIGMEMKHSTWCKYEFYRVIKS